MLSISDIAILNGRFVNGYYVCATKPTWLIKLKRKAKKNLLKSQTTISLSCSPIATEHLQSEHNISQDNVAILTAY